MLLSSASSFSFRIEMVSFELLLAYCSRGTSTLSEGHPHESQKSLPFFICFSRCGDANIHSPGFTKCIKPDFWEHALVFDSDRVIPMSVKAAWIHALEIPRPRKPQVNKAVEERVHYLQKNRKEEAISIQRTFN